MQHEKLLKFLCPAITIFCTFSFVTLQLCLTYHLVAWSKLFEGSLAASARVPGVVAETRAGVRTSTAAHRAIAPRAPH